jgi:hypothetical protein
VRTRLVRRCLAGTLALLLVGASAVPALAVPPDREFAFSGDFGLTGYCDFDISVEVLANREYSTTFFDQDGNVTRTQITGLYVLRLTNDDTGGWIVLNASGPGKFVFDDTGLTVDGAGPWFLYFAGQLLYARGNVNLRVDGGGETITGISGNVIELCEVLAEA